MKIIKTLSKVGILVLSMVILNVISVGVSSRIFGFSIKSDGNPASLLYLVLASLFEISIIYYATINSKWSGIKLIACLSLIMFGSKSFMTQIETLYFNDAIKMPVNEIFGYMFSVLLLTVVLTPITVLISGRMKNHRAVSKDLNSLVQGRNKLLLRISLLSIIYVILYLFNGYYVAWQFQEVRLYYSGTTELLSLFTQYGNILSADPLFLPLQIIRGLLWTGICIPAALMIEGGKVKSGIITGLLLGILISAQLLIPNPYMPEAIRYAHLIETSTENFAFGFAAVMLLRK